MDFDAMRTYRALVERKRELEADLREVKREIGELETTVLDMMAKEGVQNVKIDGKVLYLQRKIFVGMAEGYTREQVIESLRKAGLGDFVQENYNTNQLSAHFREMDEVVLPEGLKVTEQFNVRMRG